MWSDHDLNLGPFKPNGWYGHDCISFKHFAEAIP